MPDFEVYADDGGVQEIDAEIDYGECEDKELVLALLHKTGGMALIPTLSGVQIEDGTEPSVALDHIIQLEREGNVQIIQKTAIQVVAITPKGRQTIREAYE